MINEILVISAIVFYIFICYREGNIFYFINKFFKKILPEYLWKPVFNCSFCMNFWYGSFIYWIFFHISVTDWILVILASGGLQAFFIAAYSIYIDIEHIADKYTGEDKKKKEEKEEEEKLDKLINDITNSNQKTEI